VLNSVGALIGDGVQKKELDVLAGVPPL